MKIALSIVFALGALIAASAASTDEQIDDELLASFIGQNVSIATCEANDTIVVYQGILQKVSSKNYLLLEERCTPSVSPVVVCRSCVIWIRGWDGECCYGG